MYFSERQKRLVFRERYRTRMNDEKVKITIGDEEFTLRPRNRQELPNKRQISQAVEAMKTPQDWKNFTPLLIGCRHSNFIYKKAHFEKWVRLAGRCDALGFVLEAAKQSTRTGFSLSHSGVALSFANALHEKAQKADFKGEETAAALRYGEQAANMMEWPEHTNPQMAQDPKRQPFFIGVLTELAAARAIEQADGADVDGKVRSYVQKVLGTWDFAALDRKQETWYDTEVLLGQVTLIYSGLKMATKVKDISADKALMKTIEERVSQLKAVALKGVEEGRAKRSEKPTYGLKKAQAIV